MNTRKITICAAVAMHDIIGNNNSMIWSIVEDFKNFKALTLNKPIIMGRKTFESLPRILPERKHIVISNNSDYASTLDAAIASQITVVTSLQEALKLTESEDCCIIGGGQIYEQALEVATNIEITRIFAEFQGDTKFPKLTTDFVRYANSPLQESIDRISKQPIKFVFESYRRC